MADWVIRLMESLGYAGIVFVIFLENVFPPIPSEAILPFAGFLTTRGTFSLAGVVGAATLGSVLGALVLYAAGALFGRERIYQLVARYGRFLRVGESDVLLAERWFRRYGAGAVFFGRMMPIVRSLISIPAGLSQMRLPLFLLYTAAGTMLWNVFLVVTGAALGAAWMKATAWLDYYQAAVIVAAAALIVLLVLARLRRSSR